MKINKRIMSFALSVVMLTNGLVSSSIQIFGEEQNTQSISTSSDEIEANINGHDYVIDDNGATYVQKEQTGLSYLDYESSIMGTDFDALGAVQSLDQEANNHRYYDSPSVGERFYVSRNSYNKGKMAGICISEDSGNIDWALFSKLYDFAYINCYDFRDDSYDEMLEENIKGCEENNIPYGISAIVDFKYTDDVDSKSIEDATTLKKIVSKHNPELPTLLKVDDNYDDGERLFNEYGLADYIMNDTNYYSTMAASYIKELTSVYGSIYGKSYGFVMTEEIYQRLREISDNFPEEDYYDAINIAEFVSIYELNKMANYKVTQDVNRIKYRVNNEEIDYEKMYINDEDLSSRFYELDDEHKQIVKKAYLKILSKYGIPAALIFALLSGAYIYLSKENQKGSALRIRK